MQLQTANNHKILHWTCEICACMRAQLKPTENYWVYIPGLTLSQPQSQPQSLHPCNRDSTKSYTFKPLSPLATKQGGKGPEGRGRVQLQDRVKYWPAGWGGHQRLWTPLKAGEPLTATLTSYTDHTTGTASLITNISPVWLIQSLSSDTASGQDWLRS